MEISKETFSKMIRAMSLVLPKYAPKFDDEYTLNVWYDAFSGFDEKKMIEVYVMCRDSFSEFPSIKDMKYLYSQIGGREPERKYKVLKSDDDMSKIMKMLSEATKVKK